MNPQTVFSAKKSEEPGSAMRTEEIFTPGATPMTPLPFLAAATVPATCVPWVPTSRQAPVRASGLPYAQDAESAALKFGARSWCWSSTPVSRMPTLTEAEPVVTAQAWSALIWVMSARTGSPEGVVDCDWLAGSAGL